MPDNTFLKSLAERIRLLRKSQGISQEMLAELANMHPNYIGKIERASINASILSLKKIAQALKIPLPEMVKIPTKKEKKKDAILQNISARLRSKDLEFLKLMDKLTDELCRFMENPKKKRK